MFFSGKDILRNLTKPVAKEDAGKKSHGVATNNLQIQVAEMLHALANKLLTCMTTCRKIKFLLCVSLNITDASSELFFDRQKLCCSARSDVCSILERVHCNEKL